MVWRSEGEPDVQYAIDAQRYDALGQPLGDKFRVNLDTVSYQAQPAVAMDDAGNFVVAWFKSNSTSDRDGRFQLFNAAGQRVGDEMPVGVATFNYDINVGMDAAGNFVVSWQSFHQGQYGVSAQRFSSAGVPLGPEIQVATYADHLMALTTSLDVGPSGDFLLAWSDADGSSRGVFARRYSSAGAPQGNSFRVNSFFAGEQVDPSVALSGSGTAMISWVSRGQDVSGASIYMQMYDEAGMPVGPESRAYDSGFWPQDEPSVAVDVRGDFVTTWTGSEPGNGREIFGRRFSATGSPQGGTFRVNTSSAGAQSASRVAVDSEGDFAVVWNSFLYDSLTEAVYARFLSEPEISVADGVSDIPHATGTVSFGTVELNHSAIKTFTISNFGGLPLDLTAPITVPAGFTVVAPPALTTLNAGASTTFSVQLDARLPGLYSGPITIASSDSDESVFQFNVTGTVLPSQILDDGQPGFTVSSQAAWSAFEGGVGRDGDFRFALGANAAHEASWTFSVTPGAYRVAATWAENPQYWATNSLFSVYDGTKWRANTRLNQRQAPDDFTDAGSTWEDLGGEYYVTGGSLSVKLLVSGANGYVVADGVRIERVGDLPSGPEIWVRRGEPIADNSVSPPEPGACPDFCVSQCQASD